MKIDFSQPILDVAGQVTHFEDSPLTLSRVAIRALLTDLPDDQGKPERVDVEKKLADATLATRIQGEETLDLTAEQIANLKARIGRMWGRMVILRAWALLDPPGE